MSVAAKSSPLLNSKGAFMGAVGLEAERHVAFG
jgi:hypothetical protein